MLEELLPGAWHRTDRYAINHIEADHGRLKARLHPMHGLKQDRSEPAAAFPAPTGSTGWGRAASLSVC